MGRARPRPGLVAIPYVSCGCQQRKRGYVTRDDARSARRRLHDSTLQVYRCVLGRYWHLGHVRPGESRETHRSETEASR